MYVFVQCQQYMTMDLLATFKNTLHTNFPKLPPKARFLLGVSGGSDSMALLVVATQYALQMGSPPPEIAHVNYGLRGKHSDLDEQLVRSHALKFNCTPHVLRSKKHWKNNVQANARQTRYKFFHKTYKQLKCNCLLLGHHLDDQIESFFMNLAQGKDIFRMGIPSGHHVYGMPIVRPFLGIPKNHLQSWLQKQKVPFREDMSNFKPIYLRNVIRTQTLPSLHSVISEYRAGIKRNLTYLLETKQFFEQRAKKFLQINGTFRNQKEIAILLSSWNALTPPEQRSTLETILHRLPCKRSSLSSGTEQRLRIDTTNFKSKGHKIVFQSQDLEIQLEYSHLVFFVPPSREEQDTIHSFHWHLNSTISYMSHSFSDFSLSCKRIMPHNVLQPVPKNTLCMKIPKDANLNIRFYHMGEHLVLNKYGQSQSLKNILINKKIPKRFRSQTLIFSSNNKNVAWANPLSETLQIHPDFSFSGHNTNIMKTNSLIFFETSFEVANKQ